MRPELRRPLQALTEEEARHVYNALAQWADNERNGLEESDPMGEHEEAALAKHALAVAAVEAVVERLESEIIKAAE